MKNEKHIRNVVRNVVQDVLFTAVLVDNALPGFFDIDTYWRNNTSVLLFLGHTANISGGRLYNELSGSSDFLTVGGSAGSYTFTCPNTASYLAADADYIWFRSDTTQRTVTESELVSYDIPRTPVQFDADSPYSIRAIAILKSGITLTALQRNRLFDYFSLPVLWDDSLNLNGEIKGNRFDYTPWIPKYYLYKPVGNEYAYVADNNALDAKDAPFVICGWVLGYDKTALNYLFGKNVYGSLNGRYGFYSNATTGYISAILQGASAAPVVNSTIDVTSGWHFLLMEAFKLPGGEILFRFYIDNNLIGTSGLCGYSLGTMANAFEFYIGTGNNGVGSGVNYTAKAAFRDVRIYRSTLTSDDKTNLYNGLNVIGYSARWPLSAYPILDELGTYNLNGVNLSAANIKEI